MSKQHYECNICGRKYELRKDRNYHQKYCGVTEIDDFEDSNSLKRLKNMSRALIKNNYDSGLKSGRKIKQKTLKGGVI